jgi:hypothetical protein
LQPSQGFRIEGAEAFGKLALNDPCFALLFDFLEALLETCWKPFWKARRSTLVT